MITNAGMSEIGNTLAQRLGTHIAIGVGDGAAAAGDSDLQFEVWRGLVETRAFDPSTNTIYLKTSVPAEYEGRVLEVGLLASGINESESTMITTVDQASESWTGGTWVTNNVRIGSDGIALNGGTVTLTGITSNLSSFGPKDFIQIASWSSGSVTAPTLRLYSDDTSYFQTTISAPGGFNVTSVAIEDLAVTGSPDLSNISELTISGNSVTIDAIRAVKLGGDSRLIKRNIVSNQKIAGVPMDIEVAISI